VEEEGEYGDSLGEPRHRGLETLMPQEPLHLYKLRSTPVRGPARERVQRKP
jgi:hypothetical protein